MSQMKIYPLENSPLYQLCNKSKLEELLGLPKGYINNFTYSRENYHCWHQLKKNKIDTRPVEDPCGILKKAQSKLNKLLSRIYTTDYLMSGKKHSNYIKNAKYHQNNPYVFCFDLSAFFQTATRHYVFSAFKNEFLMSEDVAWMLTDLVTIPNIENTDGYIPTGSPSSQNVIYWAYKKAFDTLFRVAESKKLKFSLYVDDMTFSSSRPISNKFPQLIQKLCSKVGLKINSKKTRYFSKNDFKDITGNVISPKKELKVPNRRRKEILDILAFKNIKDMNVKEIRSLYGKLCSMRQIEPNIFPALYNEARSQYYKLGAQYNQSKQFMKGRRK